MGIMGVLASTLQSVFFARPAIANKKALPIIQYKLRD
jgi:hypothetical protein